MKIWLMFFIFIIGIAIGVSGTYLGPDLLRPYLPEIVQGKSVTLEGTVVSKELKQNMLLLTIDTDRGALLATFKKKVPKIELLVNEGDSIEFMLRKYEPFVEDPSIKKVKMGKQKPQAKKEGLTVTAPEGEIPSSPFQPKAEQPQELPEEQPSE
jgi:hypothetical protein